MSKLLAKGDGTADFRRSSGTAALDDRRGCQAALSRPVHATDVFRLTVNLGASGCACPRRAARDLMPLPSRAETAHVFLRRRWDLLCSSAPSRLDPAKRR